MWDSAWDALEVVRVTHSFLEWSALISFALVVLCDVSLHFFEDSGGGWRKSIGWRAITLNLRRWRVRMPGFSSQLDLKRLIKFISLAGFAVAIIRGVQI